MGASAVVGIGRWWGKRLWVGIGVDVGVRVGIGLVIGAWVVTVV